MLAISGRVAPGKQPLPQVGRSVWKTRSPDASRGARRKGQREVLWSVFGRGQEGKSNGSSVVSKHMALLSSC